MLCFSEKPPDNPSMICALRYSGRVLCRPVQESILETLMIWGESLTCSLPFSHSALWERTILYCTDYRTGTENSYICLKLQDREMNKRVAVCVCVWVAVCVCVCVSAGPMDPEDPGSPKSEVTGSCESPSMAAWVLGTGAESPAEQYGFLMTEPSPQSQSLPPSTSAVIPLVCFVSCLPFYKMDSWSSTTHKCHQGTRQN